jgi:putative tryptophan/tyrosine transport system ATP-binding protein
MLEVRGAQKVFFRGKPDEKVALANLDLSLPAGAFAIVIGSNGAGKSTLLGAVSGAVMLDAGSVSIAGVDVTRLPPAQRASRIARVFQDPMKGTAASMTVVENMLLADLRARKRGPFRGWWFGLNRRRRSTYRDRLAVLGLGLENRLDTKVELLSGGQRQSLSLIMAVSNAPDVLLLDEHTAALDPRTADIVLRATVDAIAAYKLTTLMVTHNMQHAVDFGDRVVMMDAGRVKLTLAGADKAKATVPDLIAHFSTKTDRMLLGTRT